MKTNHKILFDNFYNLLKLNTVDTESWLASIELNPFHELYKGHFPALPVVPGVCFLQIIKECAERVQECSLLYSQISSCKFLSTVNPHVNRELEFSLTFRTAENGKIQLFAEGRSESNCFIKLKALVGKK